MADAVLGKWQVDLSSITGLDEFGAAMGFPAERVEMFRQLSYTIEFTLEGDTYTGVVTFDGGAVPVQRYTFQLGQTFDYHAVDGSTPKITTYAGKSVTQKLNKV